MLTRTWRSRTTSTFLRPAADIVQTPIPRNSRGESVGSRFVHDFSRIPVHSAAGPLEGNATRAAEAIHRGATPTLQYGPSPIPTTSADADHGRVSRTLMTSGSPLEPEVRRFYAVPFGHDLSDVRVHHDSSAVDSARALKARAFTVDRHIVLGAEAVQHSAWQRPSSLLAHELAHVQQMRGGFPSQTIFRS